MTIITEDYVSSETAKLLKEKGMNKSCFKHYVQKNNNDGTSEAVTVCTLQAAMKWLRKYNIIIEPESVWNGKKWEYLLFIVTPQNADSPYYEHNPYKSYEECVEAAIKYCLENLI